MWLFYFLYYSCRAFIHRHFWVTHNHPAFFFPPLLLLKDDCICFTPLLITGRIPPVAGTFCFPSPPLPPVCLMSTPHLHLRETLDNFSHQQKSKQSFAALAGSGESQRPADFLESKRWDDDDILKPTWVVQLNTYQRIIPSRDKMLWAVTDSGLLINWNVLPLTLWNASKNAAI